MTPEQQEAHRLRKHLRHLRANETFMADRQEMANEPRYITMPPENRKVEVGTHPDFSDRLTEIRAEIESVKAKMADLPHIPNKEERKRLRQSKAKQAGSRSRNR